METTLPRRALFHDSRGAQQWRVWVRGDECCWDLQIKRRRCGLIEHGGAGPIHFEIYDRDFCFTVPADQSNVALVCCLCMLPLYVVLDDQTGMDENDLGS